MNPRIIVIGGGITGCSIMRDLALRGYRAILIEKNGIASGATTNCHQNLLSGMRYIVKDPEVAMECYRENQILSKICPDLVGEYHNYFVGEKNKYTFKALKKAKQLGIKYKIIDTQKAFEEIPALNRKLNLIIETEDRNIKALLYCKKCLNYSFIEHSFVYHKTKITSIKKENNYCIVTTDKGAFEADFLINSTGAGCNKIAEMLGDTLPVKYNQGSIIIQKALSKRGIQILKQPGDGDAYIVHGKYAFLGTTGKNIDDPEKREFDNVSEYLNEKFSYAMPEIGKQKTINQIVGVRPLIVEKETDSRNVSRGFKIIESKSGLINVIGGKLTTARLMAEKTVDLVERKIGKNNYCRTAITKL